MPNFKSHWVNQLFGNHFWKREKELIPMKDWAEDSGRVGEVEIRCNAVRNNEENGCGWTGMTRTVTQLGAVTWSVEDCPRCDGPVVGFDE